MNVTTGCANSAAHQEQKSTTSNSGHKADVECSPMVCYFVTRAIEKYTTTVNWRYNGRNILNLCTEKTTTKTSLTWRVIELSKEGKEKRLKQIFNEIKTLNPEILSDLNKMIRLYSQAQIIIGHLDADALYEHGKAYSERKRVYAETIEKTKGTGVEKEAAAEKAVYELRLKEWKTKAESRRWNNLFNSIDNLIIALRRDERSALEEYKKVNDLYEG